MRKRMKQPNGQGLVEYALILVLVAVIVIAILTLLGPQVGNVFSRVVDGLGGATTANGGGGKPAPSAKVTAGSAFRAGPDVVVSISVSANTSVTVVDSQSGGSVSTGCNLNCNVTMTAVGPNPGSVTVTATGGSSLSDTYPAQN